MRAMLLSHYDIRDTYDIIGEEFYDKMGPFGDNDFTEEEFTTLLQRVDDYIDSHGGKWAKRAGENDTVLILGNYDLIGKTLFIQESTDDFGDWFFKR